MVDSPGDFELDVAGRSVPGLVRTNNEDQFLIARLMRGIRCIDTSLPADALEHFENRSGYLLIVSDGMGGRAAGEIASATAVEVVVQCIEEVFDGRPHREQSRDAGIEDLLKNAVERAATILKTIQRREPEKYGMGCTMTLAYIIQSNVWVAHVGDSRAYLIRDRKITRLTRDHTWAEALKDADALSEEAADLHPSKHVLTNVLGGDTDVFVDLSKIALQPGDLLILCSDGIHGCVEDEKLGKAVVQAATAEGATSALIDLAMAGGAPDNATAVVARVGSRTVESSGMPTARLVSRRR